MKGMWTAAVLMFGIGVGCVTASFIVPPVRAGTDPQRWEYACAQPYGMTAVVEVEDLNKLGAEGWELVATQGAPRGAFCFKRPLP